MIDEPPPPPPPADAASGGEVIVVDALPVIAAPDQKGRVVIDLTQFVPPPPAEACAADDPDPFNPGIVVCTDTGPAPRLGPMVGPVDDGFGSAIPRARIKLSENAEAEANIAKTPVGGFDADGAEVRLKIDF
jgi:hypothetical protein